MSSDKTETRMVSATTSSQALCLVVAVLVVLVEAQTGFFLGFCLLFGATMVGVALAASVATVVMADAAVLMAALASFQTSSTTMLVVS